MKIIYNWIIDRPVFISISVFLLCLSVVTLLTIHFYIYDKNFWQSVLVESHGMLLDIFVFGVLILWLNQKNERRRTIQGYENEIRFFRGWEQEEGVRRTVGNIRLLNEFNVTAIDLRMCYLKGAKLYLADLSEADLSKADLSEAELTNANLREANLSEANLSGANLLRADLSGANLLRADLSEANLLRADLSGADLSGADLSEADLREADLSGADLSGANLWEANLSKNDLREANLKSVRGISEHQLSKVKTLYKVKNLNEELEIKLRNMKCGHLFRS